MLNKDHKNIINTKFKHILTIKEIKVINNDFANKEKFFNYIGMFFSNIRVASFNFWSNKMEIYYLVETTNDDYIVYVINETFYSKKIYNISNDSFQLSLNNNNNKVYLFNY